jgi:RNA polymerase sigma factor (sigma-70 family)
MWHGGLGLSFVFGALAPGGHRATGENDGAAAADRALLQQVASGQPAAVRLVARRLLPVLQGRVRRALRRLTPAHVDDAEDVVQKIWVVLLKDGARQLLAYDAARGISLEAYVGMIAEREVRNHIQHETAAARRPAEGHAPLDEAGDVPNADPGPEADVLSADFAARLDAHLMGSLGPKGQAVLRLVYGDACAPDRAARALGCNLQVVYNWQHRIRTLAREFVAAHGGSGPPAVSPR